MKKIIFSILILTLVYACSRKASAPQANTSRSVSAAREIVSTYPVENPLVGYLKAAGHKINGSRSEIAVPSDEMGLSFKPLTDGIITAITVKIPAVREDLPVTIWDKEEVEKLVNLEVNVAVADKPYTFPIKQLRVYKNKEYIISMNTNSYYFNYKSTGVSYPIKVGNILITNFCQNDGVQKKIPLRNNVNYYKGNISFNFQKIDGNN
jgi:hypothetical protein